MEYSENEKAPSSLLLALRERLGLNTTLAQNNVPIDSIKTAFEDADWHTRVEAVLAANEYPDQMPLETLLSALQDEDVSVRAAAVHVLGDRKADVPVAQLIEALHDNEWLMREASVLALGKLGERMPREQLMVALDDDNVFVQEAAHSVLDASPSPVAYVTQVVPPTSFVTRMIDSAKRRFSFASHTSSGEMSQDTNGFENIDSHVTIVDLEPLEPSKPMYLPTRLAKTSRLSRLAMGGLAVLVVFAIVASWLALAQKLHPSTAHNGTVSTASHFNVSTVPTVTPHTLSGKGAIVLTYHSQGSLEYPTWSSDGKHLLFVSDVGDGQDGGGSVYSWDVTTNKLAKTFTLPTLSNATGGYAWSPDGTRIILASYDGKLQLFDAFTGRRILATESPSAFEGWPNFDWSPDNRYLALTGADGTLQIWDANTGKRFSTFPEHLSNVYWISWSPDGQHIVTIIKYGLVQVWDAATGKQVSTINNPTLIDVQWSPNGRYLVSRNNDGSLTIWDALTGRQISSNIGDDALWMCNNTRVLSPNTNVLDIWDAATGKTVFTLPEPPSVNPQMFANYMPPSRWALSPDCKLLALGSGYSKVQVLDAATGHLLSTFHYAATIEGVSWSSDGRYVSATANDKNLLIWNALTGSTIDTYHLASNTVYSIGWSPDDSFIFTVSVDRVLQVLQTT